MGKWYNDHWIPVWNDITTGQFTANSRNQFISDEPMPEVLPRSKKENNKKYNISLEYLIIFMVINYDGWNMCKVIYGSLFSQWTDFNGPFQNFQLFKTRITYSLLFQSFSFCKNELFVVNFFKNFSSLYLNR